MNGFRLIHRPESSSTLEHHFDVGRREPGGTRHIAVQFADEVVSAASKEAGRLLDGDYAFWRRQAGLALARYAWTHADVPAEGRLVVREITRDVLNAASAGTR